MVTDGDVVEQEFRFAEPVVTGEPVRLTDPKRRERVLTYLRGAAVVDRADGVGPDVLDPAGRAAVPIGHRTDGRWIWPDAVEYYLAQHFVAPEPEFLERIVRHGFRCPPVVGGTSARARTALQARDRSV